MFSLIRRISTSVIPRPDRPWEDDPTSNAPNTRRKRRLSSTEPVADTDEEQARKKKLRGESTVIDLSGGDNVNGTAVTTGDESEGDKDGEGEDVSEEELVSVHREGSLEVKNVTKGVKEVELEDKSTADVVEATTDEVNGVEGKKEDGVEGNKGISIANPESIPLPEGDVGELDELRSSQPPQPQHDSAAADPQVEDLSSTKKPTEDREEKESATSRPPNSARSSTRKVRSPKKVPASKA